MKSLPTGKQSGRGHKKLETAPSSNFPKKEKTRAKAPDNVRGFSGNSQTYLAARINRDHPEFDL